MGEKKREMERKQEKRCSQPKKEKMGVDGGSLGMDHKCKKNKKGERKAQRLMQMERGQDRGLR